MTQTLYSLLKPLLNLSRPTSKLRMVKIFKVHKYFILKIVLEVNI